MKKLFNASFLVAGTAIGAGLIALPLMAVNLGMFRAALIIVCMIFIAYYSSMMIIDLNEKNGSSASIVELSNNLSGRKARMISLLSFYMLSISLLTAYFSGAADSLQVFLNLKSPIILPFCGLGLFAVLCLNLEMFSKLNSLLVTILLMAIGVALSKIYVSKPAPLPSAHINASEIFAFLPVIFTSFGVQNICPHIYEYLNSDKKLIRQAFLIGIIIPAFVYIVWIYFVFENVIARDPTFFANLQQHQVSVGELVKFLCESSNSVFMAVSFKILSLFAIITSAIGIGLGLLKSFQESISPSRKISSAIICVLPIALVLIVPNAFINVLSFGGMIATVFVAIIPYYLLAKNKLKLSLPYTICLLFGITVAICELLQKIF